MAISKLDPRYTLSMKGFGRLGCGASITKATQSGFTVSGQFSDQADFVEFYLYDEYDQYGHLQTNKYLPDNSLKEVQLEFDLALTGCMSPTSPKFPSVPWNAISYITSEEIAGTIPLPAPVTTTGAVAASCSLTVAGTPTNFDRVQIVYLGNEIFDYLCDGTETLASILNSVTPNSNGYVGLVTQINRATSSISPLSATSSGSILTITCSQPGRDGDSIQLLTMYKSAGNTQIYPTGTVSPTSGLTAKLTGGIDPTSYHYRINFSALGIDQIRQVWLTLAPQLTYNSGATNSTLVAYVPSVFSAVFSNWTVLDPLNVTPLKLAGPGSVVVGNRDVWAQYSGSGWAQLVGDYYHGYAQQSSDVSDRVIITYSCNHTHDLYLGTSLQVNNGDFTAVLDGGNPTSISCYALTTTPIPARLKVASTVLAGTHTLSLTVAFGTGGTNGILDFIQAAVLSDPVPPAITYTGVSFASDFDTPETQSIPPVHLLWNLSQMGFKGDIDFYCGVFGGTLKRVRNGGSFTQAIISISGSIGSTDSYFVDIGGLTIGAENLGLDTATTLAQRLSDGINGTFVGVCAIPTATPGQFTVTVLSPINGFTISVSKGGGSTGTIALSGSIGVGNEGTWSADSTQSSPLHLALTNYLTDLCTQLASVGQTLTAAFSMEILGPQDANTSGGAWAQRYSNGQVVFTGTGEGTWGAGVVNGLSSGTYTQVGHGYTTGCVANFANATQRGSWQLVVINASMYSLGQALSNSGGYTPAIGDSVDINLQTTQCTFNPSTVTPYLGKCYVQAANIMAAAGITPWLQFGEILWWFFSQFQSVIITGMTNNGGTVDFATATPHGLSTGQTAIVAGAPSGNGTATVIVLDSTHFTNGTAYTGPYVVSGTVSGGGMAFYDAWAVAAATASLSRPLGNYYTQDDVPNSADSAWLRSAIAIHISTIRTAILAAQSGAKLELLYPADITTATVYWNYANPYPQGGRLNNAVDFPTAYESQSGSGLNRLKIEALSWGSQYRDYNNIRAAVLFPFVFPNSWTPAQTAYLLPIYNGGCPYPKEYLYALGQFIPQIVLFAVDHVVLFDWPLPLPINGNLSTIV